MDLSAPHVGCDPVDVAEVVTSRRDGPRILNRIAGLHVLDLCTAVCATANRPARPAAPARR